MQQYRAAAIEQRFTHIARPRACKQRLRRRENALSLTHPHDEPPTEQLK
jgi:hypothetical protein